jgi:signal peptidase
MGGAQRVTRARNIFTWITLVVAIAVAALIVVPSLLGFDRYAIDGGSMEPRIPKGSIVYSKPADAADLVVGDVITYRPPASSGVGELVTHRIVEKTDRVNANGHAQIVFRSKGDANPTPDPWHFTLENGEAALEKAHLPYLGYIYLALRIPWVRIVLITVPALLILVLTAASLWYEAGREVEEERRKLQVAG